MNRLATATSPYLLQHAHNPVDWYPWGPEALERARREDKPILLSIGYAACHWCHVMERESFEDPQVAALMNEHFVNIKVDREERPDLDAVYMQAVQAMTGHGGWPMTVFLLPTGEPFYGGTYFPPADRHGMPGFPRLLQALAAAYREDRGRVTETGARVRAIYEAAMQPQPANRLEARHLDGACRGLESQFDEVFGGFGGAPKFPPSMALDALLKYWGRTGAPRAREMVHRTMLAMIRGGICDQVGGGIHRYAVDERWLVPHFEKMLYDNALFIGVGVEVWRATRDAEVRRATEHAITWVAREMVVRGGGFASSLDADSEGHEGRFYVWTSDQLEAALGSDAAAIRAAWGVTPAGNFEGYSIPFLSSPPDTTAHALGMTRLELDALLDRARECLYPIRAARPWPTTDDKVVAAWNGLMIRALCTAAEAWPHTRARELAIDAGTFVREHLVQDARVYRSWRRGQRLGVGFLEDAAAVALAFLDLFALTGEGHWLSDARAIVRRLIGDFRDPGTGLFFDTAADHEPLLTRPRDIADNATPAGGSLSAEVLARLSVLDDDSAMAGLARDIVEPLAPSIERFPAAFGHLAGVADWLVHGPVEIALVGESSPLDVVVGQTYVPARIIGRDRGLTALTRAKEAGLGYVCRRYLCDAPTGDPTLFEDQLKSAGRHRPA